MKTTTRLVLVATAAFAVLAIGCGDDDDESVASEQGPATSELSKDEWIAEADAICDQSNDAIDEQAGEFFGGGAPEAEAEAEFVSEVLVPGIEDQVSGISELGAPAGDEDTIAAVIEKAEEGLAQLREKPDPAAFEDPDHPLSQAGDMLGAYGSEVCGA